METDPRYEIARLSFVLCHRARLSRARHPRNGIGRLVDRRKMRNTPTAKNRAIGIQAAAIGGILAPAPRAMQILPAAKSAINNNSPPATPPRAPRRENTTHIGLATKITTNESQGRAKRYQN